MEFTADIFSLFDKKWPLLTAGTAEKFNTMTVSWGGMGTLWGKPVCTVYVRPNRFTYEFMENGDTFTVSVFPEEYRKALTVMGRCSGRDCNKPAEAGLTPKAVEGGMTYEEAEVTFVCRKLYAQDMELKNIPADVVKTYFSTDPVHRMYIGEVVDILRK